MSTLTYCLFVVGSFLMTFFTVFLRGFQHKNVIGGHMRSIVAIAYLIYVADFIGFAIIIKNDWRIVFISALGASLGMYASVTLHNRIYKSKHNA